MPKLTIAWDVKKITDSTNNKNEELNKELIPIKEERNKLNLEAKKWAEKRNKLNEKVQTLRKEANSIKEKRDIVSEKIERRKTGGFSFTIDNFSENT